MIEELRTFLTVSSVGSIQGATRLSSGWTPHLTGEVIGGALDAAVILRRTDAPSPVGLILQDIAADQLVAVAPRSLGVTRRSSFDQLFEWPWVLNPDGCGYRSLLVSHAASMRKAIHAVAEVQGADLQRELVMSGLGIGFVPKEVARTWVSQHRGGKDLVVIDHDRKPFAVTAGLISGMASLRLHGPIAKVHAELVKVFAKRRCTGARHSITFPAGR